MKIFRHILFVVLFCISLCFMVSCNANMKIESGISVSLLKTTYTVGEVVDETGLTVEILYSNGDKTKTSEYTIEYKTASDYFAEGDDYFTVVCGTFREKVSVNVERKTAKISVSSEIYDSVISGYLGADDVQTQISYLTQNAGVSHDKQNIIVSWEEVESAKTYVFHLSLKNDFSDEIVAESNTCDAVFGTLIPNTNYYAYAQALNNDGEVITQSEICTVKVASNFSLRQITVDGLTNVRDLGGWSAQNGATVNYGLLYRGASLANITEKGKKTFANQLGIKTEIDLRSNGTQQAVIDGVNYCKCGMWQYSMIMPGFLSEPAENDSTTTRHYDNNTPVVLRKIFTLLADESNYPIYFHCNAGADRTGTLAFLINGLLGVDYSDLIKDFELTTFSINGARYRSKVENGVFTDDGIMMNTTGNYVGFGELYSLMMTNYGATGKPLSYAIANYLISVCRIQPQTIAAVRKIMLGSAFIESDLNVVNEKAYANTPTSANKIEYNKDVNDDKITYTFLNVPNKTNCYFWFNSPIINEKIEEGYKQVEFKIVNYGYKIPKLYRDNGVDKILVQELSALNPAAVFTTDLIENCDYMIQLYHDINHSNSNIQIEVRFINE